MTQLRASIEEYIDTINQILHAHSDDKGMREAASKAWPDKSDPRPLVFKKTGLRFTTNPANAGGGDDARLVNEMPQTTVTAQSSDLRMMLEQYVIAITVILQSCQEDAEMIIKAKDKWPSENDPRRLVFTLFKG
jgi:hypothetical protein